MTQLHKRLTTENVRMVLNLYIGKKMETSEVLNQLGIKKRQFYNLLSEYRKNKKDFSIEYPRKTANRKIAPAVEQVARTELEKEKLIIDSRDIPVSDYNYSVVRDEVVKITGHNISLPTIINRAKSLDYYIKEKPKKRLHDREVITDAVGMLLQHDSSIHRWSPFIEEKWTLITTIDDHSRKLLFGDFFEKETVWGHIKAVESVVLKYGSGLSYYADNHSIFRFVCHRDSIWQNQIKGTDDAITQWRQVVESCGMNVIYALSAQAKGKVERPYRWLQDRIVRRCAKGGVKRIGDAKEILFDEIKRYNTKQVHSTTMEIPNVRFQRAIEENRTMFKPLKISQPITSTKDIFCLKETRRVNGYHQVSWQGKILNVKKDIPIGAIVQLNLIPENPTPELRLWHNNKLKQVFRFVHKN